MDRMKLNIGEKLICKTDINVSTGINNTEKIIKEGTPMYVGADTDLPSVNYLNGYMQILSKEEFEVTNSYSVNGIADWIYNYLSARFPIDDMLEDYDENEKHLKELIADSLEDLGMYNYEGNRS